MSDKDTQCCNLMKEITLRKLARRRFTAKKFTN